MLWLNKSSLWELFSPAVSSAIRVENTVFRIRPPNSKQGYKSIPQPSHICAEGHSWEGLPLQAFSFVEPTPGPREYNHAELWNLRAEIWTGMLRNAQNMLWETWKGMYGGCYLTLLSHLEIETQLCIQFLFFH